MKTLKVQSETLHKAGNCSPCMRATKGLGAVKTVVLHGEQDIRKQVGLKKKWPYVMASVKAGYTGQLSSAQASQDAQWPEFSDSTSEDLEMGQHTCMHKHPLGINEKCIC